MATSATPVQLIDPTTGAAYNASIPSGPVTVRGDAANGAAETNIPVATGGRAATSVPSPVANGQRVTSWHTVNGGYVVASGINGTPNSGDSYVTWATIGVLGDIGSPAVRPQALNTGGTFDMFRGDTAGLWTHPPVTTVSTALSGTIATSGGTAAITMTNTTKSEVINASTATIWASWGTPAVNSAGSFPIATGGSYTSDRVGGTLTLLSTAASQSYTVNRFS